VRCTCRRVRLRCCARLDGDGGCSLVISQLVRRVQKSPTAAAAAAASAAARTARAAGEHPAGLQTDDALEATAGPPGMKLFVACRADRCHHLRDSPPQSGSAKLSVAVRKPIAERIKICHLRSSPRRDEYYCHERNRQSFVII
jgi:hypothetical protein